MTSQETWLTGDTRKIFVFKTVDESNSARVLVGCKPIRNMVIFKNNVTVALDLFPYCSK